MVKIVSAVFKIIIVVAITLIAYNFLFEDTESADMTSNVNDYGIEQSDPLAAPRGGLMEYAGGISMTVTSKAYDDYLLDVNRNIYYDWGTDTDVGGTYEYVGIK